MRFNCTKGKSAKYIVSLYGWDIEDRWYYHYFKDAKARFKQIMVSQLKEGYVASIFDLEKDERKAFAKG